MRCEPRSKFAGWAESIVSKLDDEQTQKMLATELGRGESGGVDGRGDLRVWRGQHEGVYHEVGERVKTITVNSRNWGLNGY